MFGSVRVFGLPERPAKTIPNPDLLLLLERLKCTAKCHTICIWRIAAGNAGFVSDLAPLQLSDYYARRLNPPAFAHRCRWMCAVLLLCQLECIQCHLGRLRQLAATLAGVPAPAMPACLMPSGGGYFTRRKRSCCSLVLYLIPACSRIHASYLPCHTASSSSGRLV